MQILERDSLLNQVEGSKAGESACEEPLDLILEEEEDLGAGILQVIRLIGLKQEIQGLRHLDGKDHPTMETAKRFTYASCFELIHGFAITCTHYAVDPTYPQRVS